MRSEPSADGETPGSPFERRLHRLREELVDEGVPLPVDGRAGLHLLAEVTYARRPPHHERHVPGYGALVFPVRPDWTKSPQVPLVLPADGVDPAVLRRYADGRSTFVVVTSAGMAGLAAFEHEAGNELSAVHLQPAMRSVLSQVDLATVIDADGTLGPIGVRLNHTIPSGDLVPAIGGARHSSAQRLTYDVPGVLAVVVSESGRVTVYSGGAIAAEITAGRPATHSGARSAPATTPAMTRVQCGAEQADAQGGSDRPVRPAVEHARPHR